MTMVVVYLTSEFDFAKKKDFCEFNFAKKKIFCEFNFVKKTFFDSIFNNSLHN